VPVCVESSGTLSPPNAKTDDWMEKMLVRCVSTSLLTDGRSLVGCGSSELTRSLFEWLNSGLVGAVSTTRDGSLVLEPGRDVLCLRLCQAECEPEAFERRLDACDGDDVVAVSRSRLAISFELWILMGRLGSVR
jgi:hypothetical protein